jgi:hypothetical protein
VEASAIVNAVDALTSQVLLETSSYASHYAGLTVWVPSYGTATAEVSFQGSIDLTGVAGSSALLFESVWQSTGTSNSGTLTVSSGGSPLYTSPLSSLPAQWSVIAPGGAPAILDVTMSSDSYRGPGTYAYTTYTDSDSQSLDLLVQAGVPEPKPWQMALVGVPLLAFALRLRSRRRKA